MTKKGIQKTVNDQWGFLSNYEKDLLTKTNAQILQIYPKVSIEQIESERNLLVRNMKAIIGDEILNIRLKNRGRK